MSAISGRGGQLIDLRGHCPMDLSFSLADARLGARRMGQADPRIGHLRLIANLVAAQSATPTAQLAASLPAQAPSEENVVELLVTLMAGDAGWIAAPHALGGSFHPATARTLHGERP